ncbi:MAG: hypothetical protein K6G07_00775 [Lachnospiraceae bacterium]|nr:hypothetical protein [Lachnospiraceae bacterium]
MAKITYSIKKNRLERSYISGFLADPESPRLYFDENTGIHRLYVDVIDSAEEAGEWGRFSFSMDLPENMALYVYAFASDSNTWYDNEGRDYSIMDALLSDEIPDVEKKRFFSGDNGMRFVGKNDILLYRLKGRYLYIAIEILGVGAGYIDRLRVDKKGDNFMDAFPAVYRERDGFFHRFLSVFSSIYNDVEREIDRLPELLDPDTCPAECLDVYAMWLGIDLSGDFLKEEAKRTFVKEAYNLNRMKGTKGCLLRVLEIVLNEKVIILENNTIKAYLERGEMAQTELISGGIYDVNILIRTPLSDTDRHQLLYLLEQFKPLRSRLHLIPLRDTPTLDDEIYLDMNAVVSGDTYGVMDDDMEITEDIVLE